MPNIFKCEFIRLMWFPVLRWHAKQTTGYEDDLEVFTIVRFNPSRKCKCVGCMIEIIREETHKNMITHSDELKENISLL